MSRDASFVTERNRRRMLFAARLLQEAAATTNPQININLEGPLSRPMTYNPHYYLMKEGAYFTTLEEYNSYLGISSEAPAPAPAPAPPPPPPPPSESVPSAPTSLSESSGNGEVTITFTAGSDGGSAITNYKYSIDNGATYTDFSPAVTSSPVTITGLTNGTTYQIKLRAVNAVGDGDESSAVTATPAEITDAIIASLTTSLAAYNAAQNDDWVSITSSEWTALQTNVTGTAKAGAIDTYFNAETSSGLTASDQSALVANGVTVNSPAILANRYLYAFALRWPQQISGSDLRVFTNTNSSSTTGFNQVGSVLPATPGSGSGYESYYYVRKGVSTTNGATNGKLAIFTGTAPTKSGSYIGFTTNFSINAPMQYAFFAPASAGNPSSSTTLTGNLTGYGFFLIQGLTTATKQWA